MDEVHKPEKSTFDDLKNMARMAMTTFFNHSKEEAIRCFGSEDTHIGLFSNEDLKKAIRSFDFVIFEVPEHQFGQDTNASESVLERLRREFKDKFQAPLEEVADKVGMLGNISWLVPYNKKFPMIGGMLVEGVGGEEIVTVHVELLPGRDGREARFAYPGSRATEYMSIADAFKELVRILEEQGQMIPKI